jgi:hypothetical protein
MLLVACDSQLLSPNTVLSSAAKRAMVKMLTVKFNTAETGHACSFQPACLEFIFPAPCTLCPVQPNTHKRTFNHVTVIAKNTVMLHVGTSLNYA